MYLIFTDYVQEHNYKLVANKRFNTSTRNDSVVCLAKKQQGSVNNDLRWLKSDDTVKIFAI